MLEVRKRETEATRENTKRLQYGFSMLKQKREPFEMFKLSRRFFIEFRLHNFRNAKERLTTDKLTTTQFARFEFTEIMKRGLQGRLGIMAMAKLDVLGEILGNLGKFLAKAG